ncbi:MAG TPA: PEP-CTERM sorting domain-containing protein [Bryobacteraceae bacterium]|nr:PEP-CTERM sorting domain-containing protein [Bryobacteraceae bacterium]
MDYTAQQLAFRKSFNSRTKAAVLALAAAFVLAGQARAGVISLDAVAGIGGQGWLAILPPGAQTNNCYPCSDPIDGPNADPTIAPFEANNSGWNSSPVYNTAGWTAYSGSWIDRYGTNPFFARDVVDIPGTPTSASFTMGVDDDSLVWVNGTLVPGLVDDNGGTNSAATADITPYLSSGLNVIAFLADNSAGGGFSVFDAYGSITYTPDFSTPEPSSLALCGLGLATVLASRRRVRA